MTGGLYFLWGGCCGAGLCSLFFARRFRELSRNFKRLGEEAQNRVREMDAIRERIKR